MGRGHSGESKYVISNLGAAEEEGKVAGTQGGIKVEVTEENEGKKNILY